MTNFTHDYSYTNIEQQTWRQFFKEIERAWDTYGSLIHPYYLDNVHVLSAFRDQIPSLAQIDSLLRPIGWRATYVEGYAPSWETARLLSQNIMPISRAIRSSDEIFFANEPDIIHDIFGHLPSLMSADFRGLLAKWSGPAGRTVITEVDRAHYHLNKLIVQSKDKVSNTTLGDLMRASKSVANFIASHPSPILIYDRTYFWIFEFGVMEYLGQKKVLGAGLLSSLSELSKLTENNVTTRPMTIDTVLSQYNISSMQNEYIVANDIRQYDALIEKVSQSVSRLNFSQEGRHASL